MSRDKAEEGLRDKLLALHATRERTWPAEKLKVNVDQRAKLVAEADRDAFVKPGDLVPDTEWQEVDGTMLRLSALLQKGPAVLVFFRFAGCPVCNIALPHYATTLVPALEVLGATLVALSPQIPERLRAIKAQHAFPYFVATDRDNALGRRFGILYSYSEASRAAAERPIGDVIGTGTWELPMPAVVVIGTDHRVHFADVAPDWLLRTEAEPVVAAVRRLVAPPATS